MAELRRVDRQSSAPRPELYRELAAGVGAARSDAGDAWRLHDVVKVAPRPPESAYVFYLRARHGTGTGKRSRTHFVAFHSQYASFAVCWSVESGTHRVPVIGSPELRSWSARKAGRVALEHTQTRSSKG